MRQNQDLPVLALALAISLPGAVQADSSRDYPDVSALYYDFEVAGYCGLITNQVGRGFQRRSAELIAEYGLDQETISRLRGKAWQAAHAEWQNRGLGGFRNWCRTEGRAAAEQMSNMADSGP